MEPLLNRGLQFVQAAWDLELLAGVRVGGLVMVVIVLIVVVIAEQLIRRFILVRVLKRTHLDASLQYAVARIVGYVLIIIGLYAALLAAGLNLGSLAVIAGAVGVGLGFGLQNIISNFISGIIILAERPIAIGDRIDVGGVAGQVSSISLRSTTILTNDNLAIIVPNSQFITEPVTNWSHGDSRVRFRLPVGVAYGTDVEKFERVLLEVGAAHPKTLKDPPPKVFFIGFGESSLDFELAVWTSEMTFAPRRYKSDLYFAMEKALRQNNIQIPFPQRDLHLRSGVFVGEPAERSSVPRS
jgi:small-conductance mechanosensitive channel